MWTEDRDQARAHELPRDRYHRLRVGLRPVGPDGGRDPLAGAPPHPLSGESRHLSSSQLGEISKAARALRFGPLRSPPPDIGFRIFPRTSASPQLLFVFRAFLVQFIFVQQNICVK